MKPRFVLAAAVLTAAISLGAYFIVANGDENSDARSSPFTATAAGITARITDVEYSSTSTVIYLEIDHPTLDSSRLGTFFVYLPSDMKLTGFNEEFSMRTTIRRGVAGVDRRELSVGEVLDPDQPVGLTIARLCVLRSADTPECDHRDGPWVFKWTPGAAAVDAVNRRRAIHESKEVRGVIVTLEEVRLSSSEMVITARFESSSRPDETVLPGVLSIALGPGKDLWGEGGEGNSSDPPGLIKDYRFPLPPGGMDEVEVKAEIFSGPGDAVKDVSFIVPLP